MCAPLKLDRLAQHGRARRASRVGCIARDLGGAARRPEPKPGLLTMDEIRAALPVYTRRRRWRRGTPRPGG